MKQKIWRYFLQILTYRNDLIDIIIPFFQNLNNNSTHECFSFTKTYSLQNDNQNQQNHQNAYNFLKSLSNYQRLLLRNNNLLNQETYEAVRQDFYLQNNESEIGKILHDDDLEKLRQLIIKNQVNVLTSIIIPFNGVKYKRVPILIYSIIQKSTKCLIKI